MRKTLWISLHKLKKHEFHRTLRIIHPGLANWPDVYLKVAEIEKKLTANVVKLSGSMFVLFLLLNSFSSDGSIEISVGQVTARTPSSFVSLVASFSVLIMTMQLINLFAVMSFKIWLPRRVRIHGFSSEAYGLIHGSSEVALSVPVSLNFFLKARTPILGIVGSLLMLAIVLAVLAPYFTFMFFLAQEQIAALRSGNEVTLASVIASAGLVLLTVSVLLLLASYIPLPYRKDKGLIRWVFLYSISALWPHPQSSLWLEDKD